MTRGESSVNTDPLLPLLRDVQEGDADAFATLYDRTSPRLFGIAMGVVGNPADAEDVLSEVYQQIWRTARGYEPGRGSVLTWMIVICRSRALDAIRRRRGGEQAPLPEIAVDDSALDELERAEIGSTALARALHLLSEEQRHLLAMAFFRGMTHQEIADATRMPLGTVKSHIRRGLLALKTQLAQV